MKKQKEIKQLSNHQFLNSDLKGYILLIKCAVDFNGEEF